MKRNTYHRAKAILLATTLVPAPALAFDPSWIIDFIQQINRLTARVVPLLIGIAFLVFVWGVVRFIGTDDDRVRTEGKSFMVWGIMALFVIVSVWGLVELLQTLVGVSGGRVTPPQSYF